MEEQPPTPPLAPNTSDAALTVTVAGTIAAPSDNDDDAASDSSVDFLGQEPDDAEVAKDCFYGETLPFFKDASYV